MTNTNLLQAMGHIDPKLITDAAPDAVVKKSASNTWIKWTSLAAAFCLIAAVGIVGFLKNDVTDNPGIDTVGLLESDTSDNDSHMFVAWEKVCLVGDVYNGKNTNITHNGFDETSITLYIEKKNDAPLQLYFRGFNHGELQAVFSVDEDLIFTVNGESAPSIPIAPGKYEVKIDYSAFISKCDKTDTFLHYYDSSTHVWFTLDGEGFKVEGIEDISDWGTGSFDIPDDSSPWRY
ncbi:MAG: hypothetical protein J6S71_01170 [Clostridia bacterium]|nr:hypothetical protein [Clostridia bacterium]